MEELNFKFKYGEDHGKVKSEQYNKYESIIISLRDPIERMTSAWYWRMLLQCRFDQKDETRTIRNRNCSIFTNPEKCCRVKGDEERTPEYWNRYNGHAYNLAESFCSNDVTIQEQAYKDINLVPHVGHTIVDWLGLLNSNNNTIVYNNDAIQIIKTKFFAVTSERGYDFNEQIDGAIEWLLNITYNGDEEKASLHFHKAKQDAKNNQKEQEENNITIVNHSHSSKAVTFPWLKEVTPITTFGSCCLVRHYYKYKNDYLLLLNPKFPNWLCNKGKTKTKQLCYSAISSIIERKRSMLEYALYSNRSCADIDSAINVDVKGDIVVDNDNENGNENGSVNGSENGSENGTENRNGNNISISYNYNTKGDGGGGSENETVQQIPSAVKNMMMTLFGLLIVLIQYYYKRIKNIINKIF